MDIKPRKTNDRRGNQTYPPNFGTNFQKTYENFSNYRKNGSFEDYLLKFIPTFRIFSKFSQFFQDMFYANSEFGTIFLKKFQI